MKRIQWFVFSSMCLLGSLTGNAQIFPPNWTFVQTNQIHNFQIPAGTIQLSPSNVVPYDYVGVFYVLPDGSEMCAGYSVFQGTSLLVQAYGDNPATSQKEGFSPGEMVNWKIFHAGQVFPVVATYQIPGPAYPNQGNFVAGGSSCLVTLTNGPGPLQSVNVSGFVFAQNTGAPVPNHPVSIYPGNSSQIPIQVLTDPTGFFSASFTGGYQTSFMLGTYGQCGPNDYYSLVVFPDTAGNATGNFFICTDTIVTPPPCAASFTVLVPAPGSNLLSFISTSVGIVANYFWDFGDGTYSTQMNPVHSFPFPGIFNVCLSITTTSGCTSQFCLPVESAGGSGTCQANFSGYPAPNMVCVGGGPAFQFSDQSLSSTPILSWAWDFGDNSVGDGPGPVHCYFMPGVYQVCLTILTADSCSNTLCQSVWVNDSVISPDCQAMFSYYPSPGGSVQFVDNSFGGTIEWLWDFGDGSFSQESSPLHVFTTPGQFNVCQTIYTSSGCSATWCELVDTDPSWNLCEAMFAAYPDSLPNSFLFQNMSMTPFNAATAFWNFGDGASSQEWSPYHVFPQAGTYQVCLVLSTPACVDTFCMEVFVGGSGLWVSGFVTAGFDPVGSGSVVLTDSLGNSLTAPINQGYYLIGNVPPANYLLQAIPSFSLMPDFIPTYFINAMFWQGATQFPVFSPQTDINVNLIQITNSMSGPGSISGSISWMNFKSTGAFLHNKTQSLEGIAVILFNQSNMPVAYTLTSGTGQFEFENIPTGLYSVYPEMTGYQTYPVEVVLDEANPAASGIQIFISGSVISGLSPENLVKQALRISPNPIQDELISRIMLDKAGLVQWKIVNLLGEAIYTGSFSGVAGDQVLQVPCATLPSGLYFLEVSAENHLPFTERFLRP